MNPAHETHDPEWYATDFLNQLHLDSGVERKCEWTCLLWSKENAAKAAERAQVNLQLSKQHVSSSADIAEGSVPNAQFLNTVAQVYGRLFGFSDESCNIRVFDRCPHLSQRDELLGRGSLASVFVTILHKAAMSAMTDRHPLDSGMVNEEYNDVYGVDLTNYRDLEDSLKDGRFQTLYQAVLNRAKQLAGIPWQSSEELLK